MAQGQDPVEPTLKWADADRPQLRPDVFQVQATRNEFALLLGTRDAADPGRARLERRIALEPMLAKRLAATLAEVARNREAQIGSLDAMPVGRPCESYDDPGDPPASPTLFASV